LAVSGLELLGSLAKRRYETRINFVELPLGGGLAFDPVDLSWMRSRCFSTESCFQQGSRSSFRV